MFGKWKPSYKTGYELGFKGTKDELIQHADLGYTGVGFEGGTPANVKWHRNVREDVVMGAFQALKAGRPENLALVITGGVDHLVGGHFSKIISYLDADKIKSMNLSQKAFYRLFRDTFYQGDEEEGSKVRQLLLDSGLNPHYNNDALIQEAQRNTREDVVYLLQTHGTQDANETLVSLRAQKLKLLTKVAMQDKEILDLKTKLASGKPSTISI